MRRGSPRKGGEGRPDEGVCCCQLWEALGPRCVDLPGGWGPTVQLNASSAVAFSLCGLGRVASAASVSPSVKWEPEMAAAIA